MHSVRRGRMEPGEGGGVRALRRIRGDIRMTYKLEDYLKNAAPPEETPAPAAAIRAEHSDKAGPLDDHDREWLRRLLNEPGYPILLRMLQNIVLRYDSNATLLSQNNPLGNKDALADAWAYAGVAKQVKWQLENDVAAEIAKR